MEEKKYTLRNLRADDMFTMLRIINKIGLKEARDCFNSVEIRKAISDAKEAGQENGAEDALASAVGMQIMIDVAALLVSKLPDCEKELYAFLASLAGTSAKEIASLPMAAFYDLIMDVFQKGDFKDFFQRVVGSLKLEKSASTT